MCYQVKVFACLTLWACGLLLLLATHAPAQSVATNNTIDILEQTAAYARACQWPDGNITFKPQSPNVSFGGFVDHPASMVDVLARCYLYTGNSEYLQTMRLAIDFLRRMEPMHGQYYGGTVWNEQCGGMDAHGCWAQSFVIPVVWYYMLTGDQAVIDENYAVIADAYDRYLEQQPFMNNCYNQERLFYWKGLIFAKIVMDMKGDTTRSAKYEQTIRFWRDSFNYAWLEPHGYFSQWPYIEYDFAAKRLKLNAYLMPFYANDQFSIDTFWAYWEYIYTTTSSLYFDSWLIDETLHARQLKGMRSLDANLPLLTEWADCTRYAKTTEAGNWTVWYLLRFLNESFWLKKGNALYANYFEYRGWPPSAAKGTEIANLLPMAEFAHYDTYLVPQFRYPVDQDTHLSDVLVAGEVFTSGGATETLPSAFYDAGIKYPDVLFYSQRNPQKAMDALGGVNLEQYRIIFISNRHAGAELSRCSAKLLDWVKRGGSLVLLNTGTEDAGYPWLPAELSLGQTAGYGLINDPVIAATYADSPLVNQPNKLTSAGLQNWGPSAGSAFANVNVGWQVVVWRAMDKSPLLVQRTYGQGWICATTLDTTSSGRTHPELIANLYAYGRARSGQLGYDSTAAERAFEYPRQLPVIPHIEGFRFMNETGVAMPYPFASTRMTPYAQPFTMSFEVKSPVAGSAATVLIPVREGFSARVTVDGKEVSCPLTVAGDQKFKLLEMAFANNHVTASYKPGAADQSGVKHISWNYR